MAEITQAQNNFLRPSQLRSILSNGSDVVAFSGDESATLPHDGAGNSGPWEDEPMRGDITFWFNHEVPSWIEIRDVDLDTQLYWDGLALYESGGGSFP